MTAHQAALAFQDRQAKALKHAYQQAFKTGQANYRGQYATPPVAATTAPTAAATSAQAQAQAMSRALAPALTSLARMGAQIALIVPTAAQIVAAGTLAAATAVAVREYLVTSAWLLAGAISVVWAAEQAGYAFAAGRDGLLLDWQLDPAADHCPDCPALATLPPMPLQMWPTFPGEGLTECRTGCRCSFRAVGGTVPVLEPDQEQLLARVANRQPALVAA